MKKKKIGKIFLVGAGPGNPQLITVLGKELVEKADVIMYDALIGSRILDWARPDAEKIFVGKAKELQGEKVKTVSQSRINQLMVQKVKQGHHVVRLKGGDPLIFARGGEEAEYLVEKGVSVEIIPGITAALGAFASLGIPVTHRECASDVSFITGHEDPKKDESRLDYALLAQFKGTLIFYMGLGRLKEICASLVREGKNLNTPVVVVEWTTTPLERWVDGNLKTITSRVKKEKLKSPCLILVGEVIARRIHTQLKKQKPLIGKSILVTRAKTQSGSLRDRLENLGAQILMLPTIRFEDPSWTSVDKAIVELSKKQYDWVIFTSQNGVEFFDKRLDKKKKDWRLLSGSKVACIGKATANSLKEHGVRADLVPNKYVAEDLFRVLKQKVSLKEKRFLLLRGDLSRPYLKDALKKAGALVKEVVVYKTKPESRPSAKLVKQLKDGFVDFVPFSSSSSVENLLDLIGNNGKKPIHSKTKIISIGPITSKTVKSRGLKVFKQAREYSIDGVVEAILSCK